MLIFQNYTKEAKAHLETSRLAAAAATVTVRVAALIEPLNLKVLYCLYVKKELGLPILIIVNLVFTAVILQQK